MELSWERALLNGHQADVGPSFFELWDFLNFVSEIHHAKMIRLETSGQRWNAVGSS